MNDSSARSATNTKRLRNLAREIDRSVSAVVGYVRPQDTRPYNYAHPPPDGTPWENCVYEERVVRIHDARMFFPAPALHMCGFELAHAPTRVRDFHDEWQIRSIYYGELQALALEATGGTAAYVFDHLVRRRERGRPALGFGRKQGGTPGAVGRVHNDCTENSARRRLASVVGESEARALAGRRYCIVNIWRGIRTPVLDAPLALCDSRSVQSGDLVESEIRYADRTGEIFLAVGNTAHRWAYFPGLDADEAIVFKQFDSQRYGVSRFTLHAAFESPALSPAEPLRESIEARVLVVF